MIAEIQGSKPLDNKIQKISSSIDRTRGKESTTLHFDSRRYVRVFLYPNPRVSMELASVSIRESAETNNGKSVNRNDLNNLEGLPTSIVIPLDL